jgi:Fe-S-cluster-containing dehydrogenase component
MSGNRGRQPTRREALSWVAAVAAASPAAVAAAAPAAPELPKTARRRFGMAIDLDRCTRCQACVVACASENNVPPLGREAATRTRPIHWMDMLAPLAQEREPAPGFGHEPFPIPCLHCENPPCVKVCPVGATYQADDGVVTQIWDRCIGCRACMLACPYDRRYYNWSEPTWPGGNPSAVNPDVAVRPAGVVEVCTLCNHRIRARYERARLDDEQVSDEELQRLPACAETCPTEAITFGDLADPDSGLAALARSPRARRLLEHLGTEPKVFYLRRSR